MEVNHLGPVASSVQRLSDSGKATGLLVDQIVGCVEKQESNVVGQL